MKHYYLRGEAGDIIYAVPAIREVSNGGVIINGMDLQLHNALKPLIDSQTGFTLEHESEYGFPKGTVNLEGFRHRDYKRINQVHLAQSIAEFLDVEIDLKKPWLTVHSIYEDTPATTPLNITSRYRDRFFNWKQRIAESGHCIFIGHDSEAESFKGFAKYYPTENFLHAAMVIKSCGKFMGNQSACLAIAQGLGVPYKFQRCPSCRNTVTGRSNEQIMNRYTFKLHFTMARLREIKNALFVLLAMLAAGCGKKQVPAKPYYPILWHDENPYIDSTKKTAQ